MAKLDTLLKEADELISSKLQTSSKVTQDDDIFKLAEELKTSTQGAAEVEAFSLIEKIAHSVAIVDTLLNLETLSKIAALEEKAKEAGFSEGQISDFFEKKASPKFKSVMDDIEWLRG